MARDRDPAAPPRRDHRCHDLRRGTRHGRGHRHCRRDGRALKDALKPNLVQTLEGQPHMCMPALREHRPREQLAGRRPRRPQFADYVGHGGRFRQRPRLREVRPHRLFAPAGWSPSAVVLVATTQALKRHGGIRTEGSRLEGSREPRRTPTDREGARLRRGRCSEPLPGRLPVRARGRVGAGARARRRRGYNDGYEHGGAGASALAELVVEAAARNAQARFLYELDDPIETSSMRLPAGVRRDWSRPPPVARATLERLPAEHRLPVCVRRPTCPFARPGADGCAARFVLPVRSSAPILPMAGSLPCAARRDDARSTCEFRGGEMDLDAEGRIVGLA